MSTQHGATVDVLKHYLANENIILVWIRGILCIVLCVCVSFSKSVYPYGDGALHSCSLHPYPCFVCYEPPALHQHLRSGVTNNTTDTAVLWRGPLLLCFPRYLLIIVHIIVNLPVFYKPALNMFTQKLIFLRFSSETV